jgi:hypothetical protein
MKTQRVEITQEAWVELALGSAALIVESLSSGPFLLHFSNSATAPDLDAPAHEVQTFRAVFDFDIMALALGQRVWARAKEGTASLIVSRDVDVWVGFLPLNSDALITSSGNTFTVKEA